MITLHCHWLSLAAASVGLCGMFFILGEGIGWYRGRNSIHKK